MEKGCGVHSTSNKSVSSLHRGHASTVTRSYYIVTRDNKGIATRSKKLLVAPGLTTSNRKLGT